MSRNFKEGKYLGYSTKEKKHSRIRTAFVEPFLPFVSVKWADMIEDCRINRPEYLKPIPPNNLNYEWTKQCTNPKN